jgi:hypothetical protein
MRKMFFHVRITAMFRSLVFSLLIVFGFVSVAAAFDEINTSFLGNLAVSGYDSTAYFQQSRPVEGDGSYVFKYEGANWRFADQKSHDLFAANPTAYAPQYGGYCSNQMSLGNLSDVDPGVWLIHDGKLFLFGHDIGRDRWQRLGVEKQIIEADKNWKKYLAQN